jgi:hypothetical protein
MGDTPKVEREWILGVVPDQVRIRCRFKRQGKQLLEYTVQLELQHENAWQPAVRYDNAHGFCHCDTIHPDGTQDKKPIHRGDANANFTWAIKEIRASWQSQRARFLSEIKP